MTILVLMDEISIWVDDCRGTFCTLARTNHWLAVDIAKHYSCYKLATDPSFAQHTPELGNTMTINQPNTSKAGSSNSNTKGKIVRVMRIKQGKTGKTVDIILAGDLEKMIDDHLAAKTVWPTFVHTRACKKYTYSGLVAMFRRYVAKAGLTDFGMYDLKGKGATDMYRAGTPLERIQHLLGHDSVITTEVYLKARLPDIAMPNMREMQAPRQQNIPQVGNILDKTLSGVAP